MCGRYRLRRADFAEAAARGLLPVFTEFSETRILQDLSQYIPSNRVPIIRMEKGAAVIDSATWGFVPSWASGKVEEPSINARGETIASRPKFRAAFQSSRCLVPADGFYEPKGPRTGRRREQYYFQQADRGVFAMAGIYSQTAGGRNLSVAIITIGPNRIVGAIHDRMPVILRATDHAKWLDVNTPMDELEQLLRPADDDLLTCAAEQPLPLKRVKDEPTLFD